MASNTILFADDSATMRIIMEKTFAAESYEVVTVPSGEAALSAVRSKSPSVVILDAGLSDVSGYDVCQAIRGDAALKGTPVILMSGVSHPYDEARGKACGASAFMKKPFDTGQLIEKVAELVGATTADAIPLADIEPIPLGVEPKPAAPPPPPPAPPAAVAASNPMPAPAPAPAGAPAPVSIPKPAVDPTSASVRRAPGTKDTIEFGMMPPRSGAPRPMPAAPAPVSAPPMAKEPVSAPPESMKVSTLAELAQMGHDGKPVEQTFAKDAIELETKTPSRPLTSPPVEVAAKVDAKVAQIAERVGGLSPEQVEAIRVLSTEIVEKVVWEVVPELAETLIKEELARLLEE